MNRSMAHWWLRRDWGGGEGIELCRPRLFPFRNCEIGSTGIYDAADNPQRRPQCSSVVRRCAPDWIGIEVKLMYDVVVPLGLYSRKVL